MTVNSHNQRNKKPPQEPNNISRPYRDKKELESRGTHPNWESWKYYAHEPVIDKRNERTYKIIIFLKDEVPEFVGFVNVLYLDEK